jgi:hypothetical protein
MMVHQCDAVLDRITVVSSVALDCAQPVQGNAAPRPTPLIARIQTEEQNRSSVALGRVALKSLQMTPFLDTQPTALEQPPPSVIVIAVNYPHAIPVDAIAIVRIRGGSLIPVCARRRDRLREFQAQRRPYQKRAHDSENFGLRRIDEVAGHRQAHDLNTVVFRKPLKGFRQGIRPRGLGWSRRKMEIREVNNGMTQRSDSIIHELSLALILQARTSYRSKIPENTLQTYLKL